MSRRPLLTGLAVTAAAALAACGGGPSASAVPAATKAAGAAKVTVKAFDFQPDPLRIAKGTRVTWSNSDAIHHSVTAGTRKRPRKKRFNKLLAESGGSASITFKKAGTYKYFCRFHDGPGMTAVVAVS